MLVERKVRPDGSYTEYVYMSLRWWKNVPKDEADGAVITEYDADGNFIMETVGSFGPPASQAPVAAPGT